MATFSLFQPAHKALITNWGMTIGGDSGGADVTTSDRYRYTTNTVTAFGTALNSGACMAGGDNMLSLIVGGTSSSTNNNRLNISDDAVSAQTALSSGIGSGAMASTRGQVLYGGGYNGSNVAATNLASLITATFTAKTSLLTARQQLGVCQSPTVASFVGGYTGAQTAVNEGYYYANNTVSTLASLSSALSGLSANQNATPQNGYITGGYNAGVHNFIGTYNFGSNASATLSAVLSVPRCSIGTFGDGKLLCSTGGTTTGNASPCTINDALFAATNANVVVTSLTVTRENGCGLSSVPNWVDYNFVAPAMSLPNVGHAYVGSGNTAASGFAFPATVVTEKVDLSTGAVASAPNLLPTQKSNYAAGGNFAEAIFAGGRVTSNTGTPTVDKLVFATDATSSATALGSNRCDAPALNDLINAYIVGGDTDHSLTTVMVTNTAFNLATGAQSTSSALTSARSVPAGMSGPVVGAITGGYNSAGTVLSLVDRFGFADGTMYSSTALVSVATEQVGLSNRNVGVAASGFNGSSQVSTTISFEWPSDANVSGASLVDAAGRGAGASANPFGLLLGGTNPSAPHAKVQRYAFAGSGNVTTQTYLGTARMDNGGVSSRPGHLQTYADRFTPLQIEAGRMIKKSGYDGSSWINVGEAMSMATSAMSTGATLCNNAGLGAFTGNAVQGVMIGGNVNTVTMLDFATDTSSSGPTALYTGVNQTGVSSASKALSCGRYSSGAGTNSVEGFSYAMRTTVASSTLSTATSESTSVGNLTQGYLTGGQNSGTQSMVEKVNHASAAWSALSATLSVARDNAGSSSDPTTGINASGRNSSSNYVSNISKLSFSTDSITESGTSLSTTMAQLAGASHPTTNYFFGANEGTNEGTNGENPTACIQSFVSSTNTLTTVTQALAKKSRSNYVFSTVPNWYIKGSTFPTEANFNQYGIIAGGTSVYGSNTGFLAVRSTLTFSADTTGSTTALSKAARGVASSGSRTLAITAGGYNNSYLTDQQTLGFSDQATFALSNLGTATYYPGTTATPNNMLVIGGEHLVGGEQTVSLSVTQLTSFIDASVFNRTAIPSATARPAAVATTTLALIAGGWNTWGTSLAGIRRIDFSTNTWSTPSATLSVARASIAAMSNGTKALLSGGETTSDTQSTAVTTTDTIDLSAITQTVGSSLNTPRSRLPGLSNISSGYATMGAPASGALLATFEKVSFSVGTFITGVSTFTQVTSGVAAAASSAPGYF